LGSLPPTSRARHPGTDSRAAEPLQIIQFSDSASAFMKGTSTLSGIG